MGQLFFEDTEGNRWMCGWDNPTQGYFAQRYNPLPKPEQCPECPEPAEDRECDQCPLDAVPTFDVLIGWGRGIPTLEELSLMTQGHGFRMTAWHFMQMRADRRTSERPLTPLQKSVNDMFAQIFAQMEEGGDEECESQT